MIDIQRAQDVEVNYAEVIRRSPSAGDPEAQGIMETFLRRSAHTFVGSVDGKVAAVYGLITPSLMSDQCYMWLLTTDLCNEHKFLLIRHSEVVIEGVLKHYTKIIGQTSAADTKAIRWLKWLGATYHFPEGKKLVPFSITRESFEKRHG